MAVIAAVAAVAAASIAAFGGFFSTPPSTVNVPPIAIEPATTDRPVPSANAVPLLRVESPIEGASVSGIVAVSGTAADPEGTSVTGEWWIEGRSRETLAIGRGGSWSFRFDSRAEPDGERVLNIEVADESHAFVQAARRVVVANSAPPVVTVTAAPPLTARGVVRIEGAVDAAPAAKPVTVLWRVDDAPERIAVVSGDAWSLTWDTRSVRDGDHAVTVWARAGGIESRAVRTPLRVVNDRPPIIEWPAPASAPLAGTVVLQGRASDPDGPPVSAIRWQLDDEGYRPVDRVAVAAWRASWNTLEVANGSHRLAVEAVDANGSRSPIAHVVTVANPHDVRIERPLGGETVEGTVRVAGVASPGARVLAARAGDAVVAHGVEIGADGTWAFDWTPAPDVAGNATVTVEAAWPDGTRATASVRVRAVTSDERSRPRLAIDPLPRQPIPAGPARITGTASDPEGEPVVVDARVDGSPWAAASGSDSWSFAWIATPGEHTIDARARAGTAGARETTVSITITVDVVAELRIVHADLQPTIAVVGSPVTATFRVENAGGPGAVVLDLHVGDVVAASREVSLARNESMDVAFTFTSNRTGDVRVFLATLGEDVPGVSAPTLSFRDSPPTPQDVIPGLSVFAAIATSIAVALLARRPPRH